MTLIPLSASEQATERALLDRLSQFWADNASTGMRTTYDRFIAATPTAPGVNFVEVIEGAVRGWWVHPTPSIQTDGQAILFIHGGAYVLGSAAAYRGLASQIASRTGTSVFVLDYPLAPEHPWPAAFDAAMDACRWLAKRGMRRLAIVGDSAGGGLSLSVIASAISMDAVPAVAAGVVFSPWTDLGLSGATMNDPSVHDALLGRDYLADSAAKYLGTVPASHPGASPLYGIKQGMPPLYIQVGSEELLLDDSRRYAAKASERGIDVQLDVWQGLHHVFQLNVEDLPSSRMALDKAADFLRRHLGNP